jgi:hypothetical protein
VLSDPAFWAVSVPAVLLAGFSKASGNGLGMLAVPLMALAARWHETPALKPGPIELPNVDPGQLVRRIGQACVDNRKARRTLGELLAPLLAGAGIVDGSESEREWSEMEDKIAGVHNLLAP